MEFISRKGCENIRSSRHRFGGLLGAGGQGRVWLGWAEPPELWFWVLVEAVGAGSLTIRLLALGMDT